MDTCNLTSAATTTKSDTVALVFLTLDVGRFAYKLIRIHRGRFADTTLVDSHTSKSFRLQFESPTFKSIRIHNLSRFAHKKVIRLRI